MTGPYMIYQHSKTGELRIAATGEEAPPVDEWSFLTATPCGLSSTQAIAWAKWYTAGPRVVAPPPPPPLRWQLAFVLSRAGDFLERIARRLAE